MSDEVHHKKLQEMLIVATSSEAVALLSWKTLKNRKHKKKIIIINAIKRTLSAFFHFFLIYIARGRL